VLESETEVCDVVEVLEMSSVRDEALEQEYTQCLQQIDGNFARAIEQGSKLLENVRDFDKKSKEIADCVTLWCSFFDRIDVLNRAPATATATATATAAASMKAEVSEKNESTSTSSNSIGVPTPSSELPPTPKMPVFSKSFAKTPMGKRLGFNDSFHSDDSGLSQSFLNQLSPATAKMVEAYKTPNHFGRYADLTPEQQKASTPSSQEGILDISDITPATPGTPEDNDYGPCSAVKSAILRLRTPARDSGQLLLASGLRHHVDTPNQEASSNPVTPVLDSPFTMGGEMLLDESHGAPPTPEQNVRRTETKSSRKYAPSHSVEGLQPTSILKSRPGTEMKSKGTPLSRSIASKRRRSLAHHLKDSGSRPTSPMGLLDSMNQLDSEEEDCLEESPEFDLKHFPSLFQSGEGAAQVTAVYSQFEHGQARSLAHLEKNLADFGGARIELMLDMLVSRGLLRPFEIENELLWRIPSTKN